MSKLVQIIALAGSVALAAPVAAQGRPDKDIPKEHRPPAGMCRIWIDGVPASQQPAPTDCASAVRNRPSNGRVIFGDEQGARRDRPDREDTPLRNIVPDRRPEPERRAETVREPPRTQERPRVQSKPERRPEPKRVEPRPQAEPQREPATKPIPRRERERKPDPRKG